MCHLLALLGAHHILHVRRVRVNNTTEGQNNNDLSLTHILPHKQSIEIYHQNIRSLRNKINEVLCHLHHDTPYILCLTDHHLHLDKLASLHIENYTLGAYYCRKTKHKGAVCMFIHNSIKFTTLSIENYCLDQDSEVCAIHLNSVYDKLCILAIYRSTLGHFSNFLSNFDWILYKFFNLKFNFILCRDININYLVESYKKY